MRFAHPRARVYKLSDGAKTDATTNAPRAGDTSSQPKVAQPDSLQQAQAAGTPNLQYLTIDVVGGHLHVQPQRGHAAGKNTPGATAANKAEGLGLFVEMQDDFEYTVTKASSEDRYTFGPLYTPGELDAHGEYVGKDSLQEAMRDFARTGVRTINKQHRTGQSPIGEIVDWCIWPYAQEVDLQLPGREVRKAVLPAGTAYVGVVWTPEEWPSVKGGAITGYSLGGRAMRVATGELLPPSRR